MAKSEAFARIKHHILTMTLSIPSGRVSVYRSLAEHIDVMPRHVAYILSTLSEDERGFVPWHRVVAEGGVISIPNPERVKTQIEQLTIEGIQVSNKVVLNFETVFIAAHDLDSGVLKQSRF